MIEKSYSVALVFLGATAALLAAKLLFGATGVDRPEDFAFAGCVLSLAARMFLKWRKEGRAHG